jgi:hypothetical protein
LKKKTQTKTIPKHLKASNEKIRMPNSRSRHAETVFLIKNQKELICIKNTIMEVKNGAVSRPTIKVG